MRVFALLPAIALAWAGDPTLVKTESGLVRGVAANGVISWKGIPYAAPPVGNLRWREPQPAAAWSRVLDAKQFGSACMQEDKVPKSEDCLTLNVWSPAAPSSQPLPVMVWIHGGAMVHGSSAIYPADALAAQGVVVVSMNFRLGRLGYFAHPALAAEAPNEVHGNYGYMDQRAALEWVQRNIAAFGGDPNQVTIFGESAGGGSVLAHLVSPMSRGLFQRAILQSPGTPGPRAGVIPSTSLAAAEKLAVDYACSIGATGEGADALQKLRALPAAALTEATGGPETIAALSAGMVPNGMAMSIIDGRFLVEQPEAAVAAGRQAKIPIMIGATDRDLAIGTAHSKDELFANFGPDAAEARRQYDPNGDQTLDELKQQVFADRTLVEPARHFAKEMARSGQPVWLYRFAYVSEGQRGQLKGAQHGFEIPFTLKIPAALVGDKVTPADKAMGDLASAYWVQFAKTGDPNGGGLPAWPRYDPKADRLVLFTNSGVIVGADPLKARLDLWERVWSRGH
jgi:para-nitrobenzyl esterase